MSKHQPYIALVADTKNKLNRVSPTFCLAKWFQVTVHLATGRTHSCHHPNTHLIPLDELALDVGALHNTAEKVEERKAMYKGQQIAGCNYCWRIENLSTDKLSDRHFKSADSWAGDKGMTKALSSISEGTWKTQPTYLELDVGNTCNMACIYCSPEFSTKWVEDIDRHGPYRYGRQTWNGIDELKKLKRFPIYTAKEHNPYEEAFLKWWPTVSKDLHTFRITGGEPLLNKITWDLIEDLVQNPKPHLDFAVNTNLMAPPKLIDRLVEFINLLKGKVRSVHVFTSVEATGEHAELIRWGLDWSVFDSNVRKVLDETHAKVVIMTTINALSYWTFESFCQYVDKLISTYSRTKVAASFNFLRDPPWLSLLVMNDDARRRFAFLCRELAPVDNKGLKRLAFFSTDMQERLRNIAAFCEGSRSRDWIGLKPYVEQLAVRRSDRYLKFPLQDIL